MIRDALADSVLGTLDYNKKWYNGVGESRRGFQGLRVWDLSNGLERLSFKASGLVLKVFRPRPSKIP